MLKVCLDDQETLQLLFCAADEFARGDVPRGVGHCFTLATLTALQKKDGGVRGIATGTTFRRLVAKTLAKQVSKQVEAACAPFQFALSTRAGVDCVGHAVRVMTETNPDATLLSIDGVVLRSAMMAKLFEVPGLRPLLPFVRSIYSQPSRYVWQDEAGNLHEIHQHEVGEQVDPLMPLLFSLAIHNALNEAKQEMLDGEELFAFLGDVYIVSSPERTRHLYNLVAEKLWSVAGIQLHTGKTRCWNQNGRCPPDMVDLGPEVRSPQGVKVLGTPIRSFEFIKEVSDSRLEEETASLGRDPLDPRLAVRVASPSAVRRTPMPPFSEDHATQLFCGVCPWPRHGHATHDGRGVGRTPWERGTSHGGEDVGDIAHEKGRVGLPICRKDGTLCVLGVLGGCFADDRRSVAPGCCSRRRSSDQ